MEQKHLISRLKNYFNALGLANIPLEFLESFNDDQWIELEKDLINAEVFHQLGIHILTSIRTDIFLTFKFFGLSLSHFIERSGDAIWFKITKSIATNGKSVYFNPSWLIQRFKENSKGLNRIYLHVLFHSLFKHMYHYDPSVDFKHWNAAADITAEFLIDDLKSNELNNSQTVNRNAIYESILKHIPTIHIRAVYDLFQSNKLNIAQKDLQLFYVDDHELWFVQRAQSLTKKSSSKKSKKSSHQNRMLDDMAMNEIVETFHQTIQKEWSLSENQQALTELSSRLEIDLKTFHKSQGNESSNFLRSLNIENRKRFNYRDFLRRFMTPREVMKESIEEFDFIYYTLGLSFYKNMPLVEPLEYSIQNVIETFVIAIDTSGSTFNSVVKIFLEETFQILKQADLGTRRVQIYLIQCDAAIVHEQVFRSFKEFEIFKDTFVLHGGGGTDFRPVFQRVEQLIENKTLKDLKGLIYFTDGMGDYPTKRTPYETAFVFYEGDQYNDINVPSWASKLIIHQGEIK
jgi:predicted metal-dependent peptidase